VGHSEEPEVFLDRKLINFNPILIRRKAEQVVQLTNRESIPLAWILETSNFDGADVRFF
jgi:hypothetical protein